MNQSDPSAATTTSFGEFNFFPLNCSTTVTRPPCPSSRATRRPVCSHEIKWPSKSRVFPFVFEVGSRNVVRPVLGDHLCIRFRGMSLKTRNPPCWSVHEGPSTKPNPPEIFSTLTVLSMIRSNSLSSTTTNDEVALIDHLP